MRYPGDDDEADRELFCGFVNLFMGGKSRGVRFRVRFIDGPHGEDVLAVVYPDCSVALINCEANSIDATCECFAHWLCHGDCSGFIGRYLRFELPKWAESQIFPRGDAS